MDDYDEVDFWGGESPSARQTSPSLPRTAGTDGNEMAIDADVDVDDHEKGEEGDEESDDGEDSEDEVMIEGMDEDDDDEPGGPMSMDLIGHR